MTDFSSRFAKHSTKELLAIINNPMKYQPAAIVAAKQVLAARKLTEEEISSLKKELKEERDTEIQKEQKKKAEIERIRNSVSTFASEVNPISRTQKPISKTITVISIVFGLIALLQIASEWSMVEFMFTDLNAKWDAGSMLFFLPMIFLPVAVVLFALRKRIGWIMLTLFISGSMASAVSMFIWQLVRTPTQFDFYFAPAISPYRDILAIIIYTISLLVVCRTTLRELYNVNRQTMSFVIVLGALLVVLPVVIFLN